MSSEITATCVNAGDDNYIMADAWPTAKTSSMVRCTPISETFKCVRHSVA